MPSDVLPDRADLCSVSVRRRDVGRSEASAGAGFRRGCGRFGAGGRLPDAIVLGPSSSIAASSCNRQPDVDRRDRDLRVRRPRENPPERIDTVLRVRHAARRASRRFSASRSSSGTAVSTAMPTSRQAFQFTATVNFPVSRAYVRARTHRDTRSRRSSPPGRRRRRRRSATNTAPGNRAADRGRAREHPCVPVTFGASTASALSDFFN